MTVSVVKIRLFNKDRAIVEKALDELRANYGQRLQSVNGPKKGKKGTDWLVYADLIVEVAEP